MNDVMASEIECMPRLRTWFAAGDPANGLLTAAVTRGDIEDTITATGTLQPKNYVDVGTQVSLFKAIGGAWKMPEA